MSSVAELHELLLATDTLHEFLRDVAVRASTEVADRMSCGLTVRTDGRPLTIASSDEFANRLDQLQYRLDEGPCLTTLRTGKVMLDEGTDPARGHRWPGYYAQGILQGLRSSLSVPIGRAGEVFGALNLYTHTETLFAPVDHERAHRFADNAAGGVAVAIRLARRTQLTDELQTALASRAIIDQAIGILMREHHIGADTAFEMLRDASQNTNTKLSEIAARLIHATTGAPPPPPTPLPSRTSDT